MASRVSTQSRAYALRMILLGEAGAGKSSLFYRIKHKGFREDMGEGEGEREADTGTASLPLTSRNVQYDAYTRTVHIAPKTKVTLTMVDTGGRERVQSLTSQYYRRANIVLLVCSLDSEYTLNRLTKWFGEAKFYVDDPDVTYAVVGVKSDLLEHEREVTTDMLHGFAGHYNIDEASVFEVSARTGAGVKEMLKALCTAAVDTYNRSERQDALPEPAQVNSTERSGLLKGSDTGLDSRDSTGLLDQQTRRDGCCCSCVIQ